MNLAGIIDDHPDDAPALIVGDRRSTFGELRRRVASARGALVAAGIEPGDRVAIIAGNTERFVEAYLGALGIGAVAVPLNPQSPLAELRREVDLVGASIVVTENAPRSGYGDFDFDRPVLQGLASEALVPIHDVDRASVAIAVFTSGSAGAPRAATLTHGNLLVNLEQVRTHAGGAAAVRADDVVLGVLPLFHVFGLNTVLGSALRAGACTVLVDHFEARDVMALIARRRVTVVVGAPAMWAAIAEVDQSAPVDVSSVRLAGSGAAKLTLAVARRVRARFGFDLREGYGLTETSPIVALAVGTDAPAGSVGRPVPGVEMRLIDERGADVLVGDEGEVMVRGPNVFAGYWNDSPGTEAVLSPDGWLRTGDVAVVDERGFLSLVDRVKDLIIVSGFNVYPAEVEDVLETHPAVARAAVVGRADERTGENVHAYVVPRGGSSVSEYELIEFTSTQLARYKCPAEVTFVDALPENFAGKVKRRELRN
ncbi:MAG: long-chain fatty acid--CoA ligase [Actinobacteria bacterium]|nr:MAG: long-chain fatty acid--CoA ligase [Actinomycetota bacterium]